MGKGGTSFGNEASRFPFVISIINTFFIVLALGAFIAMALILSEYNTNLMNDDNGIVDESMKCDSTIDTAIIGAGAAGAYASWKLSQRNPERAIHLFETNNRIGGRLYSVRVPGIGDFKADLGAMRFYREWHTLTFAAIDELGLTVINFTTPKPSEKLYYLRGEYLLQDHIDQGLVPYRLTDEERNITGRTDKMLAMWNQQFIVPGEDDPIARKTMDDKYVRNLGCFNEWQKYGTSEALKFISDISGFDDWVYGNQNLAHVSDTEYDENPEPLPHYLTIKEGTDALPKVMVDKFLQINTRGNKLNLDQKLLRIDSSTSNITLTFEHTGTQKLTNVCAKDVILATGQKAIREIYWPDRMNNLQLDKDLNSLIDIPAAKVFLAYDSPWWRNEGNGWAFDVIKHNGEELKFLTTDLPVRMVIDIGEDQTTGKSLLLVYNDMHNNLNFWKHHMEEGEIDLTAIPGEFTPTVELLNITQFYLAKLFNMSTEDIPKPYASIAHAWYAAPYYNGWHMWKLGYNYSAVQDSVLKPLKDRNVYVIGEAYSDSLKQGWIEGAYDRVEAMLTNYYGTTVHRNDGRAKSMTGNGFTKKKGTHFQQILMRQ